MGIVAAAQADFETHLTLLLLWVECVPWRTKRRRLLKK